jgi:hypothetical protein
MGAWAGENDVGGNWATSSVAVTSGWHHAVMVYDATGLSITIYYDGAFQQTTPFTQGSLSAPTTAFYIGDGFAGSISGVRVYNRVLTQAEVTALDQE